MRNKKDLVSRRKVLRELNKFRDKMYCVNFQYNGDTFLFNEYFEELKNKFMKKRGV